MVTPTCRIHRAARCRRSCGVKPAKTPCASSLYHCGGRVSAWFVSGQAVTRHPTHHALSPCRPGVSRPPQRPLPSATPTGEIVAPRALPVESRAGQRSPRHDRAADAGTGGPSTPTEPEVRRAEPVHPEDLVAPNVPHAATRQSCSNHSDAENLSAGDSGRPDANRSSMAGSILRTRRSTFRGRHVTVKVLERNAVQVTKNGAALAAGDADVTFE